MCPAGWHVPTFSEWKILAKYIDPVADTISNCENGCQMSIEGGKRLLSTTTLWQTPKSSDDFGFSALPAATRAFAGHKTRCFASFPQRLYFQDLPIMTYI
jgi:uncharacterized protein (TIGR02145 family)